MRTYEVNQEYYDERNGRYIKITNIRNDAKTAYCDTYEVDEEGNPQNEETVLFNFTELNHFKEV